MAQKSWPSGAPMRAATASIAVTPGTTVSSMSRHSAGPASIASQTAAAMAKTPGSPPETTATSTPSAGLASAAVARDSSSRLSEAMAGLVRAQRRAGRDRACSRKEFARCATACAGLRRHLVGIAGPEADDGEPAAHGRASQPGTSTIEK